MDIGLNLKIQRKKNGYTMAEVAKKIGISESSLYNYEHNKTSVPISVFIKLAILYDFDVFDVLGVHDKAMVAYDISIYYYVKAHFEYISRCHKKMDIKFGKSLPDSYYNERLKESIMEYIKNPTFLNNYPDALKEAIKDLQIEAD